MGGRGSTPCVFLVFLMVGALCGRGSSETPCTSAPSRCHASRPRGGPRPTVDSVVALPVEVLECSTVAVVRTLAFELLCGATIFAHAKERGHMAATSENFVSTILNDTPRPRSHGAGFSRTALQRFF